MNNEEDILNFLNKEEGNPKTNPYNAPKSYFENNTKSILQKINKPDNKGEDFENSLLNTAEFKVNPYQLEEGYFEQLPNKILSKVAVNKKAKIFTLNNKSRLAAAILIGVVSISGYFLIEKNRLTNKQQISINDNIINSISDEELAETGLDFLPENSNDNETETYRLVADLMKDVEDKDIEKFLYDIPQTELSAEEIL